MSTPAISVLMPVYNGERFLAEAVNSILAQSFTDYEFIIINDGSTDGSTQMLRDYAARDPRIVLIEQENRGLVATLNRGLDIARAPLVARMDADDIIRSDRFALQKAHMDAHPHIAALGSAMVLIDDQGKQSRTCTYLPHGRDLDSYMDDGGCPLAHPAVMMRRDVIRDLGGYRKAYKHAEDYDLWLRLREVAGIDNLPEILLYYRQHDNKVSFRHAHHQALVTIVARLAARQRKSGKVDPTVGLSDLDPGVIALFDLPEEEKQRLQLEMLEITANAFAHVKGTEALDQALRELSHYKGQSSAIRARILFRAARGYAEAGAFTKAFLCLTRSLAYNPAAVIRMVKNKLRSYIYQRLMA